MTLNHNGEFDTYHSDVDSNHFLGMDLFLQVLSKFTFTRISVAVTINSIYPTLPPKIRKYKHEMCRKYKCEMCKNLDTIYSYTISIDISCWFWNHKCWLYRLILWGGGHDWKFVIKRKWPNSATGPWVIFCDLKK